MLKKLAGSIIDAYDDPDFLALAENRGMMGTEFLAPDALDSLPDSSFAVGITEGPHVHRKFPTYNEHITKVSCLYWADNKSQLPEHVMKTAGYRLASALKQYKLPVPDEMASLPASPFAAALTSPSDERYLMIEKQAMDKAADALVNNKLTSLDPVSRSKAAVELSKLGMTSLPQMAWDYLPKDTFGPKLDEALHGRQELLKFAGDDMNLRALKTLVGDKDTLGPAKFVVCLLDLDKRAGLDKRYKDGLIDPVYACFGGVKHPKVVEELGKLAKDARLSRLIRTPEFAKTATISQNLADLRRAYPKGTAYYSEAKANQADFSEYGDTFQEACKLYFL